MRSRSSAVLFALAVAALAPSLGVAQFTPRWHVGDWWVVKTWHKVMSAGWVWDHMRYDVVGVEKVGKRDCFVVEARFQEPSGRLSETKTAYYVRTDDWLVVRMVRTHTFNDTLCPPVTLNRPLGMLGPFLAGEARLPRFPLRLGDNDTMFKLKVRDDCAAMLREMSGVAGSENVSRFLAEGDTAGERVVRPTGVVYQVRSEMGGNLEPGPMPGEKNITQSLQFWSDDQPWRVYEELVGFHGPDLKRYVIERTWLVASGHKG